jgi:hypothetical protein
MWSNRTDSPPNTVYAEMNEAIGGVQNGHRYDQSCDEGSERCHDEAVHPPGPTHRPITAYHVLLEAKGLFVQPSGDAQGTHIDPEPNAD